METSYNLRSPAVKRLMKEAREMKDASVEYSARPLEDNLFEWHFTFRGPDDTEFQGGIYHGRIILPPEYPMKPPSIMLLTPNGRFELHKKICLSISGYHPESWQPSWSIRTAILAIIGFLPTKGEGAIGALDYTKEERKKLARQSQSSRCPTCGPIRDLLATETSQNSNNDQRDKELAKQIMFAKPKPNSETERSSSTEPEPEARVTPATSEIEADDVTSVRQRLQSPASQETAPDPSQQATQATQPVRFRAQRRNETTSFYLMLILAVAIALLLLRRLDRVFDLSSFLKEAL